MNNEIYYRINKYEEKDVEGIITDKEGCLLFSHAKNRYFFIEDGYYLSVSLPLGGWKKGFISNGMIHFHEDEFVGIIEGMHVILHRQLNFNFQRYLSIVSEEEVLDMILNGLTYYSYSIYDCTICYFDELRNFLGNGMNVTIFETPEKGILTLQHFFSKRNHRLEWADCKGKRNIMIYRY